MMGHHTDRQEVLPTRIIQQNAYWTSLPDQFSLTPSLPLAPDMHFTANSGRQYFPPSNRVAKKGLLIMLSQTFAEPGRIVKQQQEQISPNHIQYLLGAQR